MKVHELVEVLKDVNPSSEINIHLTRGDIEDTCDGLDYVLANPKVVIDNGWHGLVTIELGDILGDG